MYIGFSYLASPRRTGILIDPLIEFLGLWIRSPVEGFGGLHCTCTVRDQWVPHYPFAAARRQVAHAAYRVHDFLQGIPVATPTRSHADAISFLETL
jgi:hypothetical protein